MVPSAMWMPCPGSPIFRYMPGDIVIGDEDGVIFVNPSDAPELLEKVNKLHENEIRIINTIEKDGTYIRPWVNEKLESLGVERINYVEY